MLMMLRKRTQQTDAVRSPTAMLVQEGVRLANYLHLRLRDNNNYNSSKSQPEIADSIKKKQTGRGKKGAEEAARFQV
jgi:hypothetical protein